MIVMYPMLIASILFVVGLTVYIIRMNKREKEEQARKTKSCNEDTAPPDLEAEKNDIVG